MTDVACFAAMTAAVPAVTMTSTFSRTNSAAISANRSLRPSAQRYSIAIVSPSIQPCSRIRCTNAAVHSLWVDCESGPRKPMVGRLRRLRIANEWPRSRSTTKQNNELAPLHLPPLRLVQFHQPNTLRMAGGQKNGSRPAQVLIRPDVRDELEKRRFHPLPATSALPRLADVLTGIQHVSKVPIPDSMQCSKKAFYSMTSSARVGAAAARRGRAPWRS